MKELASPPSLLPLYARAAVTGPMHRGDHLPDSSYTLAPQTIDPAQVAAYNKVCGFRNRDELPPTYLHVLTFPLSVALMTESKFPFPLVGLVHVANTITVRRPVSVGEQVAFTVRAGNLRPHPAGRQLDVLAEATVDGELVWGGVSTYLRRGGSASEAKKKGAQRSSRSRRVEPQGPVAQIRVPGDIGRRYGAVSGDRNPIHMYGLTAKAFGFPSAIAHGMWLKARVLATLEGRLPDSYTVAVTFKTPVLLPSTVAVASTPDEGGWLLNVSASRSGKPHLSGTIINA